MIAHVSEALPMARGTLEMDCETRAPSGTLTSPDGRAYTFSGWTELAVAIDEWRSEARFARLAADPGLQRR
jgi:N-methylhydantoinase B/oxoprolinase/acetone carboxylase alpha subunit